MIPPPQIGSQISYKDLQFEQVPITMHSSRGTEYARWVDIGMPKIPDTVIQHVFYLYKSKEDAEKRLKYGGTGFLVAVPSIKFGKDYGVAYIYGVTNWHVALRDGYSVIRINTVDGKTDIFDLEPTQWEWIPGGGDVAAIGIPYSELHAVQYLSSDAFATDAIIAKHNIGIGDDVFMVGRFITHDGGPTNSPAVRFGNISVMPTRIPQESNSHSGKSYCIDLHSRHGYSGSPVFVYRTPGSNLDATFRTGQLQLADSFLYLLGIHWGQFPELWDIICEDRLPESARQGLIKEGNYIKGVSGMTCVTPAQSILDLLNAPRFKDRRIIRDEEIKREFIRNGFPPIAESSKEPGFIPDSDNPQHKEDFNSLVSAAVKKNPQDD